MSNIRESVLNLKELFEAAERAKLEAASWPLWKQQAVKYTHDNLASGRWAQ